MSYEISIKKKLDLVTGTEGKKLYGTVDLGDFHIDSVDEKYLQNKQLRF